MPPYEPERWAEYHRHGEIPLSQIYFIRTLLTDMARRESNVEYARYLHYYIREFLDLIAKGFPNPSGRNPWFFIFHR